MNKKEFLIPIVAIVLLVLIGVLLVVNSKNESAAPAGGTATTTATSTASGTSSTGGKTTTHTGTGSGAATGPFNYYPYGNVVLSLNQAAGFKDDAAIRPIAVLEDSRCPVGVQCIQAGTVRLTVRTSSGTSSGTTEIDLNKSITVGNDTITFVSALPVPTKDLGKPSTSAYRFTFNVEPTRTIPVPQATSGARCYVGGCSAELCTDSPNSVSGCVYQPKYACYKTATCERQSAGNCGWTQTKELTSCLANPPAI